MKKKQVMKWTHAILLGLIALALASASVVAQTDLPEHEAAIDSYDPYVVVAESLGVSVDELEGMLDEDSTLAQLARDRGIEPSVLVDALVQADASELDVAIASGEIEESEVPSWRDLSYVLAVEFVYLPVADIFWDGLDGWADIAGFEDFVDFDYADEFDDFAVFEELQLFEAELLGFSEFGYAIESQRSMAYSLLDNGVQPEAVVDAVLDAETELLFQVTEPTFLDQMLDLVFGIFDFDEWFLDEDVMLEDDLLALVAQELSLDEDTLWEALDDGKTIAELAQAAGVTLEDLTSTLMAEEEAFIVELLAEEDLSESEAEEWRAEYREWLDELLTEPWF